MWLSGEGGSHWCCRSGQLPHVVLSHPLGDAIKRLGLACRGVLTGGMTLGHCSAARPVCTRDACSSGKHDRQSMARSPWCWDMACRTRRGYASCLTASYIYFVAPIRAQQCMVKLCGTAGDQPRSLNGPWGAWGFSVFCTSAQPGKMWLGLWLQSLRNSICESSVLHCPQACRSGVKLSAGLAGWILEKLYAWTDCHGNVEQSLSKEVGGASAKSKCKH